LKSFTIEYIDNAGKKNYLRSSYFVASSFIIYGGEGRNLSGKLFRFGSSESKRYFDLKKWKWIRKSCYYRLSCKRNVIVWESLCRFRRHIFFLNETT